MPDKKPDELMARDIDNCGYLYPNADRQSREEATHRGKLRVGGKEYVVRAWLKTSAGVGAHLSLQVEEPAQQELLNVDH